MMFQKKELQENGDTEESPDTIKQEVVRFFLLFISRDVASGSGIMPCNKSDKPLVVYRFCNVA